MPLGQDFERGEIRKVRTAANKAARFAVEVLEVGIQRLDELTFRQARAEGHRTRDDFWAWWREQYGDAEPEIEIQYVTIRLFADAPRLLVPTTRPRGSEKGYTDKPGKGMFDRGNLESEPEALSDAQLLEIQGWRSAVADARRREPLIGPVERMQMELDAMKDSLRTGSYDREVRQSLRVLEYHLGRVGRKVGVPNALEPVAAMQ